ncbi:MAG TPA: D-glycero-beta-D-manno-heptose 1-phosphate adenylyltransferase [Nitrospiraceae bacterium]|nr:D-glycero-beta-D-manno-heptose 1-phosphate adenylyltransferase [Nitrospiraceae bacterium]
MRSKIIELAELKNTLPKFKAQGKKIVFTNGCFDLIHVGHVRYLSEAKALGDILVVGLNTDSSVAKIKRGRPIMPEAERAEVLAALQIVDFVVLFDEDTPYALIKAIQPDILVKGGDWKKEDIIGSDIVKETHSLPFVEGISTTTIIERIQRSKVQN